jgi:cyclase
MKQLTADVFVETGLRGANHGLVTTSDGVVLIDTPHKPTDALRLRAEVERRGRLRYIVNTEPHGDHWTGNAFFDAPVVAHEGVRSRILGTDLAAHVARVSSFGPDEGQHLEGYRPNAPVITFRDEMTLHVGDHIFRLVSMPGHTPYQAAVIVEQEGVAYVRGAVGQGLSKDECVASLTALTDRYPMDVEQDGMAPMVMRLNVANLYDYVTGAGIHRRG